MLGDGQVKKKKKNISLSCGVGTESPADKWGERVVDDKFMKIEREMDKE